MARHTVSFELSRSASTQAFWDSLTGVILAAGGSNIDTVED